MYPARSAHRCASALVVGLLMACGEPAPATPRSALLITLDTTRADALSCYGNPEHTTPVLDALASEGVLFEAAHTSVPLTLPAHASMLTGLVPLRHGVRVNGEQALAGEARTIAERAHEAGIATAAFVSSVVLAPAFGLDQGFEVYDVPDSPHTARGRRGAERSAGATIDATLGWLARHDVSRPFLLWVHLHDPHHPYAPSEPFGRQSTPYLAEVATMDHELGRLLDGLRVRDLYANTFILALGDHGEAFGEHGESQHGLGCYETTLRVPLIGRWPRGHDGRRPGGRSNELAGVIDVAPTLGEALGLAPLEGIDGLSFFERPLPAERGLYFESYHGYFTREWSPIAGWLDRHGKYLHSSAPEYYDWRADPHEEHDLAREREAAIALGRAQILRLTESMALPFREGGVPELRGELEALGYTGAEGSLAAFPAPLAPNSLPSPRDGLRPSER